VHGHVLNNFSKADEAWLVPMLSAIAEAAPLLANDDDVGFLNKMALLLKPPEKKPKPEESERKIARGDAEDGE
jgi:peptidyl-tRNA hydrolase, PTH1 family